MSTGGWILMTLGIVGMTGLLAWCFYQIVQHPESTDHLHSPLDIETDHDPS
jgi:hypothetical protein